MAKADIGPKIGIEGERDFKDSLKNINTSLKTLSAESKMVASSFTAETTAQEKAAKMADVLGRQIAAQKEKLKLCQDQLEKASQKYEEGDARLESYKKAVYDAQTGLNKMEAELKKTTSATDDMGDELQDTDKEIVDITDDMGDAKKATSRWADVMKGELLASAVKSGLKTLTDLTKKAGAAMLDAAKSGAAYADDILTLSTTSGLATDTLQEYKYMAGLVDVELSTITGSLTKVTKSMQSASKGSGDAYEAYKRLGVSVKDANGNLRKSEDVFNDLIGALGKAENETEQELLAMTLMGKSAKDLKPMIAAGTLALNSFRKEAHDTGYVLSNQALQALGKAQDGMDRLSVATEATKNRFAVGLAPAIATATDSMAKTLTSHKVKSAIDSLSTGLGETLVKAAEFAADAINFVIDTVNILTGAPMDTLRKSERELLETTQDHVQTAKDLHSAYEDNAIAIKSEAGNAEKLWLQLQNLCDENGNVEAAERNHAEFIVSQLNEALGSELEMVDGQVKGYQDLSKEIDNLLKKKVAEKLLAANEEEYTNAKLQIQGIREELAQLESEADRKEFQLDWGESVLDDLWAQYDSMSNPFTKNAFKVNMIEPQERKVAGYKKDLEDLQGTIKDTQATADSLTAVIDRNERAQEAIFNQEYDLAESLLTKGNSKYQDFSRKNGKITQSDKLELKKTLDMQERMVASYNNSLLAGKEGYSKEGLEILRKDRDQTQQYLDQINAGAATWAEVYGETIQQGLDTPDFGKFGQQGSAASALIEQSLRNLDGTASTSMDDLSKTITGKDLYGDAKAQGENLAKGFKDGVTLQSIWTQIRTAATQKINGVLSLFHVLPQSHSPSKVTTKDGQYVSQGFARGIRLGAKDISRAATESIRGALSIYDTGYTTRGISGGYSSTRTYTTNVGGISLYVNGSGVSDVDQLADRVTAKLTQQLRRASAAR